MSPSLLHFSLSKISKKYLGDDLEMLPKIVCYDRKAVILIYIYALFIGLWPHLPDMPRHPREKTFRNLD